MNPVLFIPELILIGFAILVIILDLFIKQKNLLVSFSLSGLVIAGGFTVAIVAMWGYDFPALFNNMLAVDNFALFFKFLFLGIAFLVILASSDYVSKFARFRGEFYALVLLSTLGMMLMAATTELISIYIALELTSISLYVLVGFLKDRKSTEASLKYLLLGAVASAVLLYGMALIFGFTGKTQLGEIAQVLQSMSPQALLNSPALLMGIVLLIAGFGFKIAAVPFQMWVPDVYEGAPTTVTAYLSVASKAAGFAIILRIFFSAFDIPWLSQNWGMVFAVLAVISMIIGNVAAIPQTNIKRMLGYSSIAQAGYLMVGLATFGFSPAADIIGQSGIIFFLASYALTNLGAFAVVIAFSNQTGSDAIEDYAGLSKRAPALALVLIICLLSLGGIPPTAGFIGKLYLFSAAIEAGLLWLAVVGVINSVISLSYYWKVIRAMYLVPAQTDERLTTPLTLAVALGVAVTGVFVVGVFPGLLLPLIQAAARTFFGE